MEVVYKKKVICIEIGVLPKNPDFALKNSTPKSLDLGECL